MATICTNQLQLIIRNVMTKFKTIRSEIEKRARIVGYSFNGSKETNKYVIVFVFLSNINLAMAIIELVGFLYTVRDDLMKCLLQCKKS